MGMRCLVLESMLMVVGIVVLPNLSGISAQFPCGGDVAAMGDKCRSFVIKEGPQIPPSQECCAVLANFDIPCLCQKYISIAPPEQISMAKFIYVARTCGCSVTPGFVCGGYTVPPVSAPMPEE